MSNTAKKKPTTINLVTSVIAGALVAIVTGQINDQVVQPLVHTIYNEGLIEGLMMAGMVWPVMDRAKGLLGVAAVVGGLAGGLCASNGITHLTRGADFYNGEYHIQNMQRPAILPGNISLNMSPNGKLTVG